MRVFRLLLIPIVCFALTSPAKTQVSPTHSFTFQQTPLAEALSQLATETEIDLSFDPALISDETVTLSFEDQPATRILLDVIRPHRLTINLLPNGVFVLNPGLKRDLSSPPDYNFTAPVYRPVTGRIYGTQADTEITLYLFGNRTIRLTATTDDDITIPELTQPAMLLIIAPGYIPRYVSPFELEEGFELYLNAPISTHPYTQPL